MKYNHLTLDERKKIQEGIEKELSRAEIAKSISKDATTVGKEIKTEENWNQEIHLIIQLHVLNLKSAKNVLANVINMMK